MRATWMCRVKLHSGTRPGVLSRIANVFSERGINLEQVLAATHRGTPMVLILFSATDRMRDYLARRLNRISDIAEVQIDDGAGRSVWDIAGKPGGRSGW
jgi:acetolactate synthase regulatory subunit